MFYQPLIVLAASNTTHNWQGAGDVERSGIWTFYVFMNTAAFYFNFTLMVTLFRMDRRTSTDLLIAGGLCGGILVSSAGCGPFCLVSLGTGTFAGGKIACALESFGHIIGMCISFLAVAAIAHRTYLGVVKNETFTERQAAKIIISIYLVSTLGTIISGLFSPTYLVESGTFCFFDWSSKALTVFAWPLALIAGICMIYWYYQTFKRVKEIQQDANQYVREQDPGHLTRDVAKRLSFLVLLFFSTYATIMSLSFYELSGRRAGSFYDILAATTVLIYWVTAPIAYAHINKRLGLKSVLCLPFCLRFLGLWIERSKTSFKSSSKGLQSDLATSGKSGGASSRDMIELFPRSALSSSRSPMSAPSIIVDTGANFSAGGCTGQERTEGPRRQAQDSVCIFPCNDSRNSFPQSLLRIQIQSATNLNLNVPLEPSVSPTTPPGSLSLLSPVMGPPPQLDDSERENMYVN